MTIDERKQQIERALGIIEGISYIVDKNISDGLLNAVEMIDNAVNGESKGDTE